MSVTMMCFILHQKEFSWQNKTRKKEKLKQKLVHVEWSLVRTKVKSRTRLETEQKKKLWVKRSVNCFIIFVKKLHIP